MKHSWLMVLFAANVLAQNPAASDVDPTLDKLDAAGKNLKSFVTDVKLTTSNTATGDAEIRNGKVWYDRGDGVPRIRVELKDRHANGQVSADHIDYVLAGRDLIERHERDKTQQTHHVLQPGQKIDLFKLGSGPFPLPIGQDKADVHSAFDVTREPAGADDPKNTSHLKLAPKPGSDLARKFQSIDVWAENDTGMPLRIDTVDSSGDTARSTDLTNVQVNGSVGDADFTLPKIDEGAWQVTEDKYER